MCNAITLPAEREQNYLGNSKKKEIKNWVEFGKPTMLENIKSSFRKSSDSW